MARQAEVPIAASPANRKALILPGGGMRVAWQAGAVRALHDSGLRFSFGDGASGGTMNLAALLSGIMPDDLCARWRSLDVTRFVSTRSPAAYLRFPAVGAFGDFDGITGTVFPDLGINIAKIRSQTSVRGSFNVCEFDSKTVVALPNRDLTLGHLLAGISLPLVTPPVIIDGKTYTDAVWIKDCNLIEAVRAGANELWLLWCIGNTPRFSRRLLEQYVHMIEMSALGSLHEQFAEIDAINTAIAQGGKPYGHDKPIIVHLVEPKFPLPLDPDFLAGKIDAATLVDCGYRDAMRYLAKASPGGISLSPTSTQMHSPGKGIAFREVMTGRITFGETDTRRGYDDPAAIPFSLRASIDIRDVQGFVTDPTHSGDLTGHLYAPRVGGVLLGWRGQFRLFGPGDDRDTKEMVYALAYSSDGRPVWFQGRKFVRTGKPWRMWLETTTLHVTLHDGEDEQAPVIAAGILRLNLFDLIALMGTFHATGCETWWERLGCCLRFFGLFSRELWRSYILGAKWQ